MNPAAGTDGGQALYERLLAQIRTEPSDQSSDPRLRSVYHRGIIAVHSPIGTSGAKGFFSSPAIQARRTAITQSPIEVPAQLKWSSIPAVLLGLKFQSTRAEVTITHRSISPSDHRTAFDETLRTNGKPHPQKDTPGWTVTAKWVSPYLLEVTYGGRGKRTLIVEYTSYR